MSSFEGTVEEIVFRNDENGWTVISFKIDGSGRINAVGVLPFLAPGDHVILTGDIVEHSQYGRQIRVNGYEASRPETKSAVEKYLGSGLIKGIGPSMAKRIVSHFGSAALDIMETDPERLTEIPGIGPKKARLISESFEEHNGMRMTLMFLQSAGLTPNTAMKVYRAYGNQSENVLKSNPYRLSDEIEGIGFRTADEIARRLGFAFDSAERIESGILYVLSEASSSSGHIFLPFETLAGSAAKVLEADEENVRRSIVRLLLSGGLKEEKTAEVRAVYLPAAYRAECETADRLRRLRLSARKRHGGKNEAEEVIRAYETETGVRLSEGQREAVCAAAEGGVTVITGGPGTGKTTSIKCILRLLGSGEKIELCAPTGRAAKRMSDATGLEARTIHRMLEYGGEEGKGTFQRDSDHPLDADTVIVDEVSMVDIFLMRSLLRALKPGTRLILVGDADQLPSVGAGDVLRDIIASGTVRVTALDEIFRQGAESMIITNAHRINHGLMPEIRFKDTDFFLQRRETAEQVISDTVSLVRERLPKYLGTDPMRGIQVMTPMKKGSLGALRFNELLQASLNPASPQKTELKRGDTVFRTGDKVMQIRNNYDLEWTREDEDGEGVFNGDIGFIESINRYAGEMTVRFEDGRAACYSEDILDNLELSYCISVHKSQGSEFDAVVLPLLGGPQMLMTRNLLYTAVTRAKRLAVIVGREACMKEMIDNNSIRLRWTLLKERLREA